MLAVNLKILGRDLDRQRVVNTVLAARNKYIFQESVPRNYPWEPKIS
jgi:hypothetical protein